MKTPERCRPRLECRDLVRLVREDGPELLVIAVVRGGPADPEDLVDCLELHGVRLVGPVRRYRRSELALVGRWSEDPAPLRAAASGTPEERQPKS